MGSLVVPFYILCRKQYMSDCSATRCTSTDGLGGSNCWAGGGPFWLDGCTCSTGSAVLSGASTVFAGSTYYDYTCCTSGSTVGDECGQYTGCNDAGKCSSSAHKASGGRDFTVVTPPGMALGAQAMALIVGIHGWTQTAKWACQAMAQSYVQQLNVVFMCPQGLPTASHETGWNTGTAGFNAPWTADDVSFIREATTTVLSQYSIANNAAYVIGFSFGGDMAFRLSCEASDLFLGFGITGQAGAWAGGTSAVGKPWASSCSPSPARRPLWMGIGTDDSFFTAADAETSFHAYSTSVLGCAPNSYVTYIPVSGATATALALAAACACTLPTMTDRVPCASCMLQV